MKINSNKRYLWFEKKRIFASLTTYHLMSNLIEFIKRYFHILLLILLYVFCIILLNKTMHYQHYAISKGAQVISAPILKQWNKVLRHFILSAENEALIKQNLQLLQKQDNLYYTINDSTYTAMSQDSIVKNRKKLYDYTTASVIFSTTGKKHNSIIIDKGSSDSIYPDMGVLSPYGVVGVVHEVSQNFASVIPLLHPNSRISAKIMPINQIGAVIWEGEDPRYGYLTDIPVHMEVNIGDSIFTSGFSNVFPKDILIGIVAAKEDHKQSTFQTIKIEFAVPFNKIDNVYLVKNLYKTELDSLKKLITNE